MAARSKPNHGNPLLLNELVDLPNRAHQKFRQPGFVHKQLVLRALSLYKRRQRSRQLRFGESSVAHVRPFAPFLRPSLQSSPASTSLARVSFSFAATLTALSSNSDCFGGLLTVVFSAGSAFGAAPDCGHVRHRPRPFSRTGHRQPCRRPSLRNASCPPFLAQSAVVSISAHVTRGVAENLRARHKADGFGATGIAAVTDTYTATCCPTPWRTASATPGHQGKKPPLRDSILGTVS